MTNINPFQFINSFIGGYNTARTASAQNSRIFQNSQNENSVLNKPSQTILPKTMQQLSQTTAELAMLDKQQTIDMLKQLLNMPKNFEQLLSQLANSKDGINQSLGLLLLAANTDLSALANLLKNNSKEAMTNLYQMLAQYNKIGMFLMFEGGHFSIDEFLSLYTSEDTIGIFVGKPNLSEQEYFDEIRAHEGEHNWTKRHSDEKLKEFVKSYHKKNLEEAEQVKKLNLDNLFYLDTSFNQLEKIDAFIEVIKPILDA